MAGCGLPHYFRSCNSVQRYQSKFAICRVLSGYHGSTRGSDVGVSKPEAAARFLPTAASVEAAAASSRTSRDKSPAPHAGPWIPNVTSAAAAPEFPVSWPIDDAPITFDVPVASIYQNLFNHHFPRPG